MSGIWFYSLITESLAKRFSNCRSHKLIRFHSLAAQLSRVTFFRKYRETFVEELRSMWNERFGLREMLNEWRN